MSPIPDRSKLQAGASLGKVRGRAKVSKKALEDGAKADLLTLRATLVPGPRPIVLDGSQDVVLGVSVGGVDVTTAYVRAGRFTKKGKKLVVARDDTCKIKKDDCRSPGCAVQRSVGPDGNLHAPLAIGRA